MYYKNYFLKNLISTISGDLSLVSHNIVLLIKSQSLTLEYRLYMHCVFSGALRIFLWHLWFYSNKYPVRCRQKRNISYTPSRIRPIKYELFDTFIACPIFRIRWRMELWIFLRILKKRNIQELKLNFGKSRLLSDSNITWTILPLATSLSHILVPRTRLSITYRSLSSLGNWL